MADLDLDRSTIAKPHKKGRRASRARRPSEFLQEAGGPSLARAQRHRDLSCPRLRKPGQGYTEYPVCDYTTTESGRRLGSAGDAEQVFQRFGLGTYLYFSLLKKLAKVFLAMGLLAVPTLVFFLSGEFAEDTLALETTTMGNLGTAANTTEVLGVEKQKVGLAISLIDVASSIIFLVCVAWISRTQKAATADYTQNVITIVNYSVRVTGLPEDCANREQYRLKLKRHFQFLFGDVVDVALAFNDGDLVELYKRRGQLIKQVAVAEVAGDLAKVEKLEARVRELHSRAKNMEATFKQRVVAAFITFEREVSVQDCLDAYYDSWWARYIMDEALQFEGHRIRVIRAPEPSNILFLNLKYTYTEKFWRRVCTFIFSIVMISVSFAVVYIAQFYQRRLPSTADCNAEIYTRAQAVAADAEGDDNTVGCYCDQLGTDVLDERPLCDDWIENFALSRILVLVSALTIVIMNYMLKAVAIRMGRFEKHFSLTNQQSAITTKLFVGLFINTALVLLLVNWDVESSIGRVGLRFIFNGEFDEFTPDWFEVVGTSVIYTMVLNTMNPHIFPVMLVPLSRCRRRCLHKRVKTQLKLNELYSGPRFYLAERYATVLNTVFVVYFYSAGMPVLLFLAAFTFFCTYWFDRYSFFRLYRTPARYDNRLASEAVSLFPWAIVMHSFVSIWFYTSPALSSYEVNDSSVTFTVNQSRDNGLSFASRVDKWNALPSFLLFLLIVIFYLLRLTIVKAASKVQQALDSCLDALTVARIKEPATRLTYSEAKKAMVRLESYHLARQRGYEDAFLRTGSNQQLMPEVELRKLEAQHRRKSHKRTGRKSKSRSRSRSRSPNAPDGRHHRSKSHNAGVYDARQPHLDLPGAVPYDHDEEEHREPGGVAAVAVAGSANSVPMMVSSRSMPGSSQSKPIRVSITPVASDDEGHSDSPAPHTEAWSQERSSRSPSLVYDANGMVVDLFADEDDELWYEQSESSMTESESEAEVEGEDDSGADLESGQLMAPAVESGSRSGQHSRRHHRKHKKHHSKKKKKRKHKHKKHKHKSKHAASHLGEKKPSLHRLESLQSDPHELPSHLQQLLPYSCENCLNTFNIIDVGVEAEYTCPFCGTDFVI